MESKIVTTQMVAKIDLYLHASAAVHLTIH